ncbi:MAG: hypothetical protein JW741_18740 [Sedimentisphaerales bacterium]|nr:hypothetical protein [Sedimentisphaerales bacterium]
MARIIYAVAGEGFGHSSRAHLIGQRFLDAGHEVMFVASQKALLYLRHYYGPRVEEIFGLSFAYREGNVDAVGTVAKNVVRMPCGKGHNRKLFDQVCKPFRPDLVITDFEPFTGWWAWRNHVPFISIDNEHLLSVCALEHRAADILARLTATAVTRSYYIGARSYVVLNFFKAPLRTASAVLVPPVVRPHVAALEPSNAGHVLVYSTTGTHEARLRRVLHQFPDQQFYLYGFNKSAEAGNCVFKERSTEGFLADLASARGVVASAGFSLMSECMCLRKRMLLLPLAGQYEQIINAHYAQKLGLGLWSKRLDEAALSRFLQQVDEPLPHDDRILWPDNDRFFESLQAVLSGLDNAVSIAV